MANWLMNQMTAKTKFEMSSKYSNLQISNSLLWAKLYFTRSCIAEKVPSSLKHFLKGICGEALNKEKKILSMVQDITFLHSNGKKECLKI